LKSSDECFLTGWKVETSIDGIDWDLVDRHESNDQLSLPEKIGLFPLSEIIPISFLRLTFLLETSKYGQILLEAFEIFGEITGDKNLQLLISLSREISVPSFIQFDFTDKDHFGLVNFFQDCSIKQRHEIFSIWSPNSENGNYSEMLIEWNEETWFGERFDVVFKYPWIFQIDGYRMKSGKDHFLQDWEISGLNTDHGKYFSKEEIQLDEHVEETCLSSEYFEKSFKIETEEFYDYFAFGGFEGVKFKLSAIELFGTLKKIQ
jgi:hypothetical protein